MRPFVVRLLSTAATHTYTVVSESAPEMGDTWSMLYLQIWELSLDILQTGFRSQNREKPNLRD